ncbi:hypothetical protein [Paenibacillus sp. HW567]|uniref:hypothetical protein n=1 Tax=Paenibacillus sp. HW567 TaxID=1034769 RepID=UPI0003644CE0|nr:hypothetical protein [Paenibacillus sp. HW567]
MLIFLMYMFAILGVILLLAAAVMQMKISSKPSRRSKLTHAGAAVSFNFPEQYITPDKSHVIALDEAGKKLAVGKYCPGGLEEATAALYTFEAILGSEIVENALTLTKVSKTSRITSSGVRQHNDMAAKAGATGTAYSADSTEEINELTLKIYLDNADTPVLSIPFLPELSPAKKCDSAYSQAFSEAHHVHEMLREIVSA